MSDQLSRDAFDKFAAEHAGTLFTGKVTSSSAPFYIAIWQAAIEWDRAQAAPQPEAVWQPIETAPIDRMVLLAWRMHDPWNGEWWERSIGYAAQSACINAAASKHPRATHWMPLPAAPNLSAAPHPTGGKRE